MNLEELVESQPVGTYMISSLGTVWCKKAEHEWQAMPYTSGWSRNELDVRNAIACFRQLNESWSFS